jgi:hypothetical protein
MPFRDATLQKAKMAETSPAMTIDQNPALKAQAPK